MKKIFTISVLISLIGMSNIFAQNKTYNLNDARFNNDEVMSPSKYNDTSTFKNATRFRELSINPIIQNADLILVNDTIVLDLFSDRQYKACVEKNSTDVNGTITIRTRLLNYKYGYCVISTFNGKSFISIEVPDHNELFMSKFDHQTNKYYLLQIDKSQQKALEGSPSLIPPTDNQLNTNSKKNDIDTINIKSNINTTARGDSIVDEPIIKSDAQTQDIVTLLIVYTPSAAAWASANETDINNTISLLMEKAQLVLDNSDTQLTLQLVHSEQVNYTELNTITDLDNLTINNDGIMDNVHSLRDSYGADVVVLLENINFTGGKGWLLNSTSGHASHAFSLTRVQQASWTYTAIQEISRNMGCENHKYSNIRPGPGLYTYSAGWRWTGDDYGQYCSIMTFESGNYFADGITHSRVPIFSDPNIHHRGAATGDAIEANNAQTIRQIKSVIAAYRSESAASCSGTMTLTTASGSFTDGSGSNNYGNNSDCKWLIQPSDANSVTLSFSSFSTQSDYDYVEIYDGTTTSDILLGSFSGSSIPSSIVSSGGAMLVNFTSDGSNTAAGWSASYTSCNMPAQPDTISGNSTVCQGQNSVNYSVPTIANATSYVWTLPSGATGTSTTNSITVDFGTSVTSGNITVKGNNSCGDGAASTLAITVNAIPPTPTISLTSNVLHSDASNGNQWYNQNGLLNGATNQDYTVSVNGDYYVIVTLLGCSSDASNISNVILTGIEVAENNKTINVYPSPVSNELIIKIEGNNGKLNFEILNAIGQVVFKGNLVDKAIVQTSNFTPGVYLIKIENGKTFEFKKIIKE